VRDILEGSLKKDSSLSESINEFLGPEIDKQNGLHAGGLILTEGQTLAIPFRSMNQPFFFVTSLLVLERFDRNLRTFGINNAFSLGEFPWGLDSNKVYVPDEKLQEFLDLVSRCLPVQARIKLTGGKTASKWKTSEGKTEKGNLWYEESVPADSLFVFFIMNRPGVRNGKDLVGDFQRFLVDYDINLSVVQMGGNETVGYGWCWWNGLFAPNKADSEVGR